MLDQSSASTDLESITIPKKLFDEMVYKLKRANRGRRSLAQNARLFQSYADADKTHRIHAHLISLRFGWHRKYFEGLNKLVTRIKKDYGI